MENPKPQPPEAQPKAGDDKRPRKLAVHGSAELQRADLLKRPRGAIGKVRAESKRPSALPLPMNRSVGAFTPADAFDEWSNRGGIGVRAVEIGDNVISILEPIGEDFWTGGGVTAKGVTAQLKAIGPRPIEVHVNSPGGDVFEGISIYNVLREHPQPVTVKVMGIAASAASIIAMAGDDIQVGAASFIMIHNTMVLASGNKADFLEVAAFLEPFDLALAEVYAQRTGGELTTITGWMDAETYMSGSIAVQRGFADRLLPSDQIMVDEKAKARDVQTNKLRAMELALVRAGESRTDARARILEIKGTPGAAPASDTPGAAANTEWLGVAAGLASSLRS